MNRPTHGFRRFVVALVLCAGLAAVAWAQSVHDVYRTSRQSSDNGAAGFYRTLLDGTDSKTDRSLPSHAQTIRGGDTTLLVVPRHTISGSTAEIEVALYGPGGQFRGIADVQTSTSTERSDGTGFYPLRELYYPLGGAVSYSVQCTNVSSGTVSLRATTIGAASLAAE